MCKNSSMCLHCQNSFNYNPKISFGKYCSVKCCGLHKQKNNIKNWLSGKVKGGNGYTPSNFVRVYLFQKYNECCSKCGWCEINETTGKIPLQINHIDGNPRNHNENNLELLCPNCHSLTDTYGILNKGKGRYCVETHPSKKVSKSKKQSVCKNCRISFLHSSAIDRYYCSNKCRGLDMRKIKRPDKNILIDEVKMFGYSKIGRKYQVSDNTIRKWIKLGDEGEG